MAGRQVAARMLGQQRLLHPAAVEACGQRGWNGQPVGSVERARQLAARRGDARCAGAGSISGAAASSACV